MKNNTKNQYEQKHEHQYENSIRQINTNNTKWKTIRKNEYEANTDKHGEKSIRNMKPLKEIQNTI